MTKKSLLPVLLINLILVSSCSSPSFILVTDPYFAETEAPRIERKMHGGVKTCILETGVPDPVSILDITGDVSKRQVLLFSPLLKDAGEKMQRAYPDLRVIFPVFEGGSNEIAESAADAVFEDVQKAFPAGDFAVTLLYSREPGFKELLAGALQNRFNNKLTETRVMDDKSVPPAVKTRILLVFCGDRSGEVIESAASQTANLYVISDRVNRGSTSGSMRILHLDWAAIYAQAVSRNSAQPQWLIAPVK